MASRLVTVVWLFVFMASPAVASPGTRGTGSRVAWTVAGVGIGFCAGLWTGLKAFDDDIYSDREIRALAAYGAHRLDGASGSLVNLKARPDGVVPPLRKWRNWQTR
jgi:hypothetical protein